MLLARVEEEIDGVNLGACQYPGTVNPAGYQHLQSFTPDPFPTWVYEVNGIRIEKRLFLVQGRQMAILQYSPANNAASACAHFSPIGTIIRCSTKAFLRTPFIFYTAGVHFPETDSGMLTSNT